MIAYAFAPFCLLDIGRWTDTAFAEHGVLLSCAASYYARVSVASRDYPGVVVHDPGEIFPEAARFLREVAGHFGLEGLEATLSSDLPVEMGMGMPAAAVALTGALASLAGKCLAPHQLAILAHRMQSEEVGLPCGLQPYMTAAIGGVTRYDISPYPRVFATPLSLRPEIVGELEQRLLLVETRETGIRNSYRTVEQRCRYGGVRERTILWRLRTMPKQAAQALETGNFINLGRLMREHELYQQRLCPGGITPEILHIDVLARHHQALATVTDATGGSVLILCAGGARTALADDLRIAGYTQHPVAIDAYGLRVWLEDAQVVQPPLTVMAGQRRVA